MFILYITSRYSHFNILFSKPCQRQYELLPSLSVVCHPFIYFHILIVSSENPQPNELKLGRKHLWKILSKECTFCYDPLPNMAATGNSCFWLADFFKSSPLKSLGQMNRNLVGSIYGMFSMKIAHFTQSVSKHGHHMQFLFLIGRFLKNLLFWNCLAIWTKTWWETSTCMEGSVLSFLKAEWKVSDTGSAHWASSFQ